MATKECERELRALSGLWKALAAMRIEPPGAALTFERRLARENHWSLEYAGAVVKEYKRFLYLAATSPDQVTPSQDVDQAWHLHLTYSRHYWDVLCGEILKRPLHHGPTEGGEAERGRYWRQYEATLMRYRLTFGTEPPSQIWPNASNRFSRREVRVDPSRYWLVPKPFVTWSALFISGALAAACSAAAIASEGQRESGTILLPMIIGVVVLATVLYAISRPKRRDDGGRCGGSCAGGGHEDSGGHSGGGGGCGGCGG